MLLPFLPAELGQGVHLFVAVMIALHIFAFLFYVWRLVEELRAPKTRLKKY